MTADKLTVDTMISVRCSACGHEGTAKIDVAGALADYIDQQVTLARGAVAEMALEAIRKQELQGIQASPTEILWATGELRKMVEAVRRSRDTMWSSEAASIVEKAIDAFERIDESTNRSADK